MNPLISLGALGALLALLASCASPAPPPQLYQLRAAAPAPVVVVPTTAVLQFMAPVSLPEALDRDALLVPRGETGVQALPGHRWAEPLRDAVPRLLRQDLSLLLGAARVWAAPLPAGVVISHRLRVEVLELQATADRSAVSLSARWTLASPAGGVPPLTAQAQFAVASASPEPDALVAAHRLALWRLAEQVANSVAAAR